MTRDITLSEHDIPFLIIEDLVVSYGQGAVVDRVSLSLGEQGITALVGPSGCGKTALLRAIAGFETPLSGRIAIDGNEVFGSGRNVEPEKRGVIMVFQDGALFPHLSVHANVGYGVLDRGRRERAADEALRLVGLDKMADRYPDQLSGGQQQLVALARALAPKPRAVLLDEPFASLDADLRGRLRDEVPAILRAAEVPAILVTHDQEEALSVADRVAVMFRGRLLQIGTPDEIYNRPEAPEVARFIGGGQLVTCDVRGGQVRSVLGELSTQAEDGPGRLLVRPEDLTIAATGAPSVAGVVIRRNFYGHDRVDDVRLESGEVLRMRGLGNETHEVGTTVRMALRDKPYRLFLDRDGESSVHQATRAR